MRVLSSVPSVSSVVIGFSRDSRLRAQTFRPLRLFFALFAVKSFSPRSLRIFAAISALKAFPTTAFETTTTHSVLAIHNSGRPPIPPLQKHRWLVRLSRCQPLFLASRRPPQERSPDLRGHSRHSAKFFLHLAPQFLNFFAHAHLPELFLHRPQRRVVCRPQLRRFARQPLTYPRIRSSLYRNHPCRVVRHMRYRLGPLRSKACRNAQSRNRFDSSREIAACRKLNLCWP
jgi:hypothetical protein